MHSVADSDGEAIFDWASDDRENCYCLMKQSCSRKSFSAALLIGIRAHKSIN